MLTRELDRYDSVRIIRSRPRPLPTFWSEAIAKTCGKLARVENLIQDVDGIRYRLSNGYWYGPEHLEEPFRVGDRVRISGTWSRQWGERAEVIRINPASVLSTVIQFDDPKANPRISGYAPCDLEDEGCRFDGIKAGVSIPASTFLQDTAPAPWDPAHRSELALINRYTADLGSRIALTLRAYPVCGNVNLPVTFEARPDRASRTLVAYWRCKCMETA